MTGFRFEDYVWEFYGYHGVYPMGASREVVNKACRNVMKLGNYEGDSLDREKVRSQLEMWGYSAPLSSFEMAQRSFSSSLSPSEVAAWLKDIVVDQYAKDPEDRDWYAKIGEVIDRLEGHNGS